MNIINCKEISNDILSKVYNFILKFKLKPSLAIVLIGENPASIVYIKRKIKIAKTIGIETNLYQYKDNISQEEISDIMEKLSRNSDINGIILQLPIPNHLDSSRLLNQISYTKDVDGLNTHNIGLLHSMSFDFLLDVDNLLIQDTLKSILNMNCIKQFFIKNGFIPCTALGTFYLINRILNNDVQGKKAIIFGHSNLVTKPLERLLLLKGITTTVIHSKSINYELILKDADIVILATGGKRQIHPLEIKNNAIVIDITTFLDSNNKLSGDFLIDQNEILNRNIKYTSVPGGIGPITVAFLMFNLMLSALFDSNKIDLKV